MEREIKFRAWDKDKKEMIHDGLEYQLRLLSHELKEEFEYSNNIGFGGLDYQLFELMQFTGLNDKNGVEIYEGDVVEFAEVLSKGELTKKIATIGFKDAAFTMDYREEASDLLHIHYQFCKAIGNTYENPELLTHLTKK